jgi:hypothetical protein
VQRCGPTMVLGHSHTKVATRMVEAQGCSILVAKAEERQSIGQSP